MDELYTQVAGQAFELAKVFALLVGSPPIPTPIGPFAIALTTPHGPSTGGGAQALQHITFVHGDVTLVVGSLEPVVRVIELRGYDHVAELFRRRWDKLLPIARHDFDQFATRLYHFAKTQDYAIVLKEHAPPSEGGRSTTSPRGSTPTAPPPWVVAQQMAASNRADSRTSPPPIAAPDVVRTGSPTSPPPNQAPTVVVRSSAPTAPPSLASRPRSPTTKPELAPTRSAPQTLSPNVVPGGTVRPESRPRWIVVALAILVVAAIVLALVLILGF